jgi:hypothetical protein
LIKLDVDIEKGKRIIINLDEVMREVIEPKKRCGVLKGDAGLQP